MRILKSFNIIEWYHALLRELIRPVPEAGRLLFLDYARGTALIFMVYSHALRNFSSRQWYVQGDLMEFQNISLLVVKGSAPLFILTFGFLIAYIYTRDKCKTNFFAVIQKFWLKAAIIFMAYRLCAYFESVGRQLAYSFFAVGDSHWVEILMFYVLLLLFTPVVIFLYQKIPKGLFFLGAASLIVFSLKISQAGYNDHFQFFSRDLNLLFFGLKGHYNFPVFPYMGIYAVGFILGTGFRFCRDKDRVAWFIWIVSLTGLGLGLVFYGMAQDNILYHLIEIKNNSYKHPPNAFFLSFSLANAFVILAFVMILEKYAWLKSSVISDMGKRPLLLFVTHFFLIFLVFSRLIGRLLTLTIGPALAHTCFLLILCYLCLRTWNRIVDLIYQPGLKSQGL